MSFIFAFVSSSFAQKLKGIILATVRLSAPRAKANLINSLTLRLRVLWNGVILLYYLFRFQTRALSVCLAK